MTDQELFDFMQAWRGIYPQFTYSDAVFEVVCEDFAEFDAAVVKEAFKDVRRNFDRMPSMSEFRQVCILKTKNERKNLKSDVEVKLQAVPFLREYILRAFDKWLAAKPKEERDSIEARIINVNSDVVGKVFHGQWRQWQACVVEAATILKEEEQAGRWVFDASDFAQYQERRKQENAERMAQTKGKLLYFPATLLTQQQEEQEKKQRRDPEWRQKKVEMNEREQLQTLIHQRDVLKSGGLAS